MIYGGSGLKKVLHIIIWILTKPIGSSILTCRLFTGRFNWNKLHQKPFQIHNRKAYERVQSVLNNHPMTAHISDKEIKQWQSWAHWITTKFQRTSSAVKGRNGALSRMRHNQRSIPLTRLKAFTVIHNFGIKRQNGTTTAQRLFDQKFPNLFEWIVERVGELPLPREHSINH